MAKLAFTKMHGLGNDFIVIDGIHQTFDLTKEKIAKLADRHYGVGFDQLLLLEACDDDSADLSYRIFNADGGEVAQCANGARCIARFAVDKNLVSSHFMRVKTKNKILELQVEQSGTVTVNMGQPNFKPEIIPLNLPYAKHYTIEHFPTFEALSIGNPHAIIWCHEGEYAVGELGRYLNQQPVFPEGVNVSFATLVNPLHIKLAVFERGTGVTLACGSAACAAAVAGMHRGVLQNTVTVTQAGGDLIIRWLGANAAVYMTGPAEYVFEGKLGMQ